MAHPYRKQAQQSGDRRVKALMPDAKTQSVSFGEHIDGKKPRAPRPERHEIKVPGGSVHLRRSFARGGSVRDVSITLRRDDGKEQKLGLKDFGLGGPAKGMSMAGALKAKLRGPKVYKHGQERG